MCYLIKEQSLSEKQRKEFFFRLHQIILQTFWSSWIKIVLSLFFFNLVNRGWHLNARNATGPTKFSRKQTGKKHSLNRAYSNIEIKFIYNLSRAYLYSGSQTSPLPNFVALRASKCQPWFTKLKKNKLITTLIQEDQNVCKMIWCQRKRNYRQSLLIWSANFYS